MALLDMIGVASILPFIAILTNSSIVETNIILNIIFEASSVVGVENVQQFLFFLGVAVFIILISSLAFKALTTYLQVHFIEMSQYNLSKKLVEGYLFQPYSWFLSRHSADLGKTILSEVSVVISSGVGPILELISRGFVAVTLISLLLIADPKLTIIVGISIGFIYWLIFNFIRVYLKRFGAERLRNNESRFKSISEAFGAAKEVKVGSLEQADQELFCSRL